METSSRSYYKTAAKISALSSWEYSVQLSEYDSSNLMQTSVPKSVTLVFVYSQCREKDSLDRKRHLSKIDA